MLPSLGTVSYHDVSNWERNARPHTTLKILSTSDLSTTTQSIDLNQNDNTNSKFTSTESSIRDALC